MGIVGIFRTNLIISVWVGTQILIIRLHVSPQASRRGLAEIRVDNLDMTVIKLPTFGKGFEVQ